MNSRRRQTLPIWIPERSASFSEALTPALVAITESAGRFNQTASLTRWHELKFGWQTTPIYGDRASTAEGRASSEPLEPPPPAPDPSPPVAPQITAALATDAAAAISSRTRRRCSCQASEISGAT